MNDARPELKAVVYRTSKFATHDGPGIRTVFFLKGCPLRCTWCHSPESWSYAIQRDVNGETIGAEWTVEELLAEALKDRDFYEASGGGVTLSGGEPLARSAFAAAFLRRAKEVGLHTAVETGGYAKPEALEPLLAVTDCWLYDVKHLEPAKFLAYTGRPLAPVLENLRRVDHAVREKPGRELILRCPMIPGLNDDAEELKRVGALADELAAVSRIDVEPYVPYGVDMAKRLGLKVYEAPQPPIEYGPAKAAELARHTHRPVRLG